MVLSRCSICMTWAGMKTTCIAFMDHLLLAQYIYAYILSTAQILAYSQLARYLASYSHYTCKCIWMYFIIASSHHELLGSRSTISVVLHSIGLCLYTLYSSLHPSTVYILVCSLHYWNCTTVHHSSTVYSSTVHSSTVHSSTVHSNSIFYYYY